MTIADDETIKAHLAKMTIAEWRAALEADLVSIKARIAKIDQAFERLQKHRTLAEHLLSAIESALSLDAMARGRNLSEY